MTYWEKQKRRMAADPEYAARQREAAVRRTQLWRKRHPDRYAKKSSEQAARRKARRMADAEYAERIRAQKRANYARRRAEISERWREKYRTDEAFRLRRKANHAREYWSLVQKMEADAELYAAWRAKRRIQRSRKAVAEGRLYRPVYCTRIPDWATKGQRILDARSPWLAVNLTDAQRAYARELAIERKERRAAR